MTYTNLLGPENICIYLLLEKFMVRIFSNREYSVMKSKEKSSLKNKR